jgi:MinD-like ATPase involved in chromosome partitioning or flagellar assembly
MSQEAWGSGGPRHDADDTSDRLYTPEDFAAYAARRETRQGGAGERESLTYGDPLTDDLTDDLADPLADPLPPQADEPTPPAPQAPPPAAAQPTTPPPAYRPSTPPPAAPPPAYQPPAAAPAAPASAPPAGPPATAPPATAVPAVPVSAVPVPAPTTAPATTQPVLPPESADEAELRRFMSATDFLDRRDADQDLGPATWGWRGRMRRWTGGLISPKMGADERGFLEDRATIQRDFDGPRTIAFINPKGGAAKTTGVLAAGYTFGTVRGGGVVAWDNNETRGTLGIRGTRSAHRNTTRELLEDLDRFTDVYQSRIGDLGSFVRSQGDAHFDVLASDERPDVTGTIRAQDFDAIHKLLERFYRVILIDTGNNMRAENWLAAAGAADLLVVTSTVREDTGYSGLWMLDALQDAGYQDLKRKTVTVLSDPSATVDSKLAADLVDVYQQRTRGVYRVPYDPALVAGSVVPYSQLSENTRMQWLRACAGMATAL